MVFQFSNQSFFKSIAKIYRTKYMVLELGQYSYFSNRRHPKLLARILLLYSIPSFLDEWSSLTPGMTGTFLDQCSDHVSVHISPRRRKRKRRRRKRMWRRRRKRRKRRRKSRRKRKRKKRRRRR